MKPTTSCSSTLQVDVICTSRQLDRPCSGSLNFALGTHGGDTLSPVEGNFGIWVRASRLLAFVVVLKLLPLWLQVGTLVSPQARLLIVAPPGKEEESVRRLARVGFQNVVGVLSGGIAAWADAGLDLLHAARAEVSPHTIPVYVGGLVLANSCLSFPPLSR